MADIVYFGYFEYDAIVDSGHYLVLQCDHTQILGGLRRSGGPGHQWKEPDKQNAFGALSPLLDLISVSYVLTYTYICRYGMGPQ